MRADDSVMSGIIRISEKEDFVSGDHHWDLALFYTIDAEGIVHFHGLHGGRFKKKHWVAVGRWGRRKGYKKYRFTRHDKNGKIRVRDGEFGAKYDE